VVNTASAFSFRSFVRRLSFSSARFLGQLFAKRDNAEHQVRLRVRRRKVNTMVDELNCSRADRGHYSEHETWRRIGLIALVLPLVLVLLGRVAALAGTLTVTANDGLTVTYTGSDSDDRHGDHLLTPVSKDDTFTLRDPSDPVVYEYLLTAQASADVGGLISVMDQAARVHGNLTFSFDLPDIVSLWDIIVDYEYHGAVAIEAGVGAASEIAEAEAVKPHGTGVVSSLGTTSVAGASLWYDEGPEAEHFDGQQMEQVTGAFGVNAPGVVSFGIDLYAESGGQIGESAGEAYTSLGQYSSLEDFDLDNWVYSQNQQIRDDGLRITLTFAPHLNLSGQFLEADLALAEGETLSGYGTFHGDVSGVAGSAITCSSGDLTVGNPASATGFNMAGDVAVTGGKLLLKDAVAPVLGGRTHISGTGSLQASGDLQIDGEMTLGGGVLDVGRLTGAGSLAWTQGTLQSTGVVAVGPEFVLGESLTMSSGQALVADVAVETGGSLTVSGGTVFSADMAVETGGSLTVSGGTLFGNIDAWNGSEVNISGGSVTRGYGPSGRPKCLYAHKDSTVNLFGTEFVLNGTDITNTLSPNVPFVIDDRDVIFSGRLADGSPFSFNLDCFSHSATLTATLVPEPSSFMLLLVGLMCVLWRRCATG
jgi:hypothetical protein